jgi:hypothetical protein
VEEEEKLMSGYFEAPPLYVLETDDDLRAALANPEWDKKKARDTRSQTCVRVVAALKEKGLLPYNDQVQREVERVLGIPKQPDNGCVLSMLVYKAQAYHRTDQRLAEGYQPFTREMQEEAYRTGRKILVKRESVIAVNGVPDEDMELIVNMIDGKLYAQPPRARRKYYGANGQPAKFGSKRR